MFKISRFFIFLSLFGFLLNSFSYSQQLPFQKTNENEWVFKEKTFDEVWSAVTKALMQIKYTITSSDKNGGIISATKKKGLFDGGYSKDELPSFQIFIEKTDDGIKVNSQFTKYSGQLIGGDKSKDLFEKIAENLYGKLKK